jgi:hypothetical protein
MDNVKPHPNPIELHPKDLAPYCRDHCHRGAYNGGHSERPYQRPIVTDRHTTSTGWTCSW